MILEHRIYDIAPGRMPEFLALMEGEALPVMVEILGECLALGPSEDGTRFLQVWRYADHADHESRRDQLLADPRFLRYAEQAEGLVLDRHADWFGSLAMPATEM